MATPLAGRAALKRGAWAEARASFEAALAEEETAEALEGLSWATWWLDDVDACFDARERAYRRYREDGDLRGAARMALWLSDDHSEFRRKEAVAGGWFQRAARLLSEIPPAPEHGWLAVFEAHATLAAGDPARAMRLAGEARELGRELGAIDVEMFAVATEGVVLVAQGAVAEGMRRLDEAAAAALGGEFDDLRAAGWTCCLLIGACERVRDFDRAAQWCAEAEAFSRRLDARFVKGVCRAHYGAVLCWHGDWEGADRELTGALAELTEKRPAWRSVAVVRLGELRRRQGRTAEALELFGSAEADPWRGSVAPRPRSTPVTRWRRARARSGCCGRRPRRRRAPARWSCWCEPTPLKARRTPPSCARSPTRSTPRRCAPRRATARASWPRRRATTRRRSPATTPRSRATRAARRRSRPPARGSGSPRRSPRSGGARPRAARRPPPSTRLPRSAPSRSAGGRARWRGALGAAPRGELSAREVEVLRLVADGLGDRQIATELTLSEHTVHRHVANIHAKLRCSSRAAAVALAHRRGLL